MFRILPLGPVHTYLDIFESATFSLRIQNFPVHTYGVFKSNSPVITYPTLSYVRIDSRENLVNLITNCEVHAHVFPHFEQAASNRPFHGCDAVAWFQTEKD